MAESLKMPKRRGRQKLTDSERQRRRVERRSIERKARVSLGGEIKRWLEIKVEQNLKTDREVATFLIDSYKHSHSPSSEHNRLSDVPGQSRIVTSTPAGHAAPKSPSASEICCPESSRQSYDQFTGLSTKREQTSGNDLPQLPTTHTETGMERNEASIFSSCTCSAVRSGDKELPRFWNNEFFTSEMLKLFKNRYSNCKVNGLSVLVPFQFIVEPTEDMSGASFILVPYKDVSMEKSGLSQSMVEPETGSGRGNSSLTQPERNLDTSYDRNNGSLQLPLQLPINKPEPDYASTDSNCSLQLSVSELETKYDRNNCSLQLPLQLSLRKPETDYGSNDSNCSLQLPVSELETNHDRNNCSLQLPLRKPETGYGSNDSNCSLMLPIVKQETDCGSINSNCSLPLAVRQPDTDFNLNRSNSNFGSDASGSFDESRAAYNLKFPSEFGSSHVTVKTEPDDLSSSSTFDISVVKTEVNSSDTEVNVENADANESRLKTSFMYRSFDLDAEKLACEKEIKNGQAFDFTNTNSPELDDYESTEAEIEEDKEKEPELFYSSYSERKIKPRLNFCQIYQDISKSDDKTVKMGKRTAEHLDTKVIENEYKINENDSGSEKKMRKMKKVSQPKDPEWEPDDLSYSDIDKTSQKGSSVKTLKKKRGQKKKNDKDEKLPWVSVNLDDYSDKYTIESCPSTQQKHRKSDVKETYFRCLICTFFKAGNRDVFKEHIEKHVNKCLSCSECPYEAITRTDLRQHLCTSHGFENKNYTYICHLCGETTNSTLSLYSHLGSEHNCLKFQCDLCNEMFASPQLRKKHYRLSHESELKYCINCDTFLKTLSDSEYKEHLSICTPTIKCDVCEKILTNRSAIIKAHMKSHTKVRVHQCHLCPYTAAKKRCLTNHLLSHDGIRPFRCDQCTFTCVQRYQLTSHMRTHTGEKPHRCDKCSYAAAWNVQLKDHQKVHDLDTAVICKHCGVVVKNVNCLFMHIRKEHVTQGKK